MNKKKMFVVGVLSIIKGKNAMSDDILIVRERVSQLYDVINNQQPSVPENVEDGKDVESAMSRLRGFIEQYDDPGGLGKKKKKKQKK